MTLFHIVVKARSRAMEELLTLEGWRCFAIFAVACIIVIFRRPDAVFHAQFFAEDGKVWFADAYNHGWWQTLFWTYNGYLHLLPRLAAALALIAPVVYAPFTQNLIAIAFQGLPVSILLSPRSRSWGQCSSAAYSLCSICFFRTRRRWRRRSRSPNGFLLCPHSC